MSIVDRLRSDGEGARQYEREARIVLGGLLSEAADEIEQLRVDLNEAFIDGAAQERAKIVAWLKSKSHHAGSRENELAEAIQAAEHLK
jgi:hypothetical protein